MKWGSIVAITRIRVAYKSHGNNVHTGLLFTLYTRVPVEHTAHGQTAVDQVRIAIVYNGRVRAAFNESREMEF